MPLEVQSQPTPPCAMCNAPVPVDIDPEIRFSNGAASTVIVIEHPVVATCRVCGAKLQIVIVGFQNIQMKTVPAVVKSQLVVPVNGLKV